MLKGIILRLEEKLNKIELLLNHFIKFYLILKLKNSNLAYPNTFMFKIFRLIIFISKLEKYYSISRLYTFACSDKNSWFGWIILKYQDIKFILNSIFFFLNKIRKFYGLYRNSESDRINFP